MGKIVSIPIKSEPPHVSILNNNLTMSKNSETVSASKYGSSSLVHSVSTPSVSKSVAGSISVKSEVLLLSSNIQTEAGASNIIKDSNSKRRETVPCPSEPKIKLEKLDVIEKQARNISKSKDIVIIEDYNDNCASQVDVKVEGPSTSTSSSKPPSNVQLLNKPPRVGLSRLQKKLSNLHEISIIEPEE